MPVRRATWADIPIMAKVEAAAFAPDSLFKAIFPFQPQHPQDFERALREHLWLSWFDFRKVLTLSYEERVGRGEDVEGHAGERQVLMPSSTKAGFRIITGMAEWERIGQGAFRLNGLWGWWDPRRLIKPILSLYFDIRRFFIPNRATIRPTEANPQPLTYWMLGSSLGPLMHQFMSAPHRQTRWSLEILSVHPAYQGKGYGRELVQHGLEMAMNDPVEGGDLPACVMAAEGKERFYQKCGFPLLAGYVSEAVDEKGRENPFRKVGVGGGAILWTR